MTDNEIIRALECHEDLSVNRNACERCPILNHWDCGGKMASNALALINRQKAEIERLEELVYLADSETANVRDLYFEEKSERAEAIKEFAEKLKELNSQHFIIWDEHIDNLVKEMVGEDAVDEATAAKAWERANVGADNAYGAYHLDQVIPVLQRTDDYVRRALEKKKDFLLAALAALEEADNAE